MGVYHWLHGPTRLTKYTYAPRLLRRVYGYIAHLVSI